MASTAQPAIIFDVVKTAFADGRSLAWGIEALSSGTVELNTGLKVVDAIFEKHILSRSAATEAYQLAEENSDVDGDPRTAWGLAQGVTRLSQAQPNASARVALDRAAGKVLEVAF